MTRRLMMSTVAAMIAATALTGGLPATAGATAPGALAAPAARFASLPGDDVGDPPPVDLPEPAAVGIPTSIQAATRVLTDAEAASISAMTTINAAACATDAPDRQPCSYDIVSGVTGLAPGSVVVAGISPQLPGGLLVTVTGTRPGGFTATEASLDSAIVQGEFQTAQALGPEQVQQARLAPGVRQVPSRAARARASGLARTSASVDKTFSYSLDKTFADGVDLKGTVAFTLGCSIDGKIIKKWGFLPKGFQVVAECKANENASIALTANRSHTFAPEPVEIASYRFKPITVYVGPVPVVMVPRVSVTVGVEGTVTASMTASAKQSFEAKAGIKIVNSAVTPYHSTTFSASAPTITGEASMSAKAYAALHEEILFYGIAGPRLTEEGRLVATATASTTANPPYNACLDAGLAIKVSLNARLLGRNYSWGTRVLWDKTYPLGCANAGGGTTPTPPPPGPGDPRVVPDVVGMPRAQAISTLAASGFSASVATQQTCEEFPGMVLWQTPAGATTSTATSVRLTVAAPLSAGQMCP